MTYVLNWYRILCFHSSRKKNALPLYSSFININIREFKTLCLREEDRTVLNPVQADKSQWDFPLLYWMNAEIISKMQFLPIPSAWILCWDLFTPSSMKWIYFVDVKVVPNKIQQICINFEYSGNIKLLIQCSDPF